jgi:hypothetical protein
MKRSLVKVFQIFADGILKHLQLVNVAFVLMAMRNLATANLASTHAVHPVRNVFAHNAFKLRMATMSACSESIISYRVFLNCAFVLSECAQSFRQFDYAA